MSIDRAQPDAFPVLSDFQCVCRLKNERPHEIEQRPRVIIQMQLNYTVICVLLSYHLFKSWSAVPCLYRWYSRHAGLETCDKVGVL